MLLLKINNSGFISGSYPNVPGTDLDELKDNGYIGKYKGTPIIKLPNYIVDETTNAEWLLDESKLFVLPAGEKPVKVALKGDLHIPRSWTPNRFSRMERPQNVRRWSITC